MTDAAARIFNLGSINADYVYRVPHLPHPGETLAARDMQRGLGGKGANQSVAAVRAGADVVHIGAIGADGDWLLEALSGLGVQTAQVVRSGQPTGHAVINVAEDGENAIVLLAGANMDQDADHVARVLKAARPHDLLLLQNETSLQPEAAQIAKAAGARVIYSAAPFAPAAVMPMLDLADMLIVNELEAEQLCAASGRRLEQLAVPVIVVTRGDKGAEWHEGGAVIEVPSPRVAVLDTTGAGDTFAGYLAAGLGAGAAPRAAMEQAAAAAALSVTRAGAAQSIPDAVEVAAFMQRTGGA